MAPRERNPSPVDELVPKRPSLPNLRKAAAGCQGCGLWRDATQTVFGEGAARATVMLVGEQPGNGEDEAGRPFVGPAGRLLDRALTDAGVERDQAYLTNVVKHFQFEHRDKRRLLKKPSSEEIQAYRPWLDAELGGQVRGARLPRRDRRQALLGARFRASRQRGRVGPSPLAPRVAATVHPSSILRAPDDQARKQAYESFVETWPGSPTY